MQRQRLPRSVRRAGAGAALTSILFLVAGHAASLSATTPTLATAGVALARCDTDGFTVIPNLTTINVTSVTVGQIAAACAGGVLAATVNNGIINSSGSGTVPGGGGSLTVTLGVPVPAKDSEQIDVAITGP